MATFQASQDRPRLAHCFSCGQVFEKRQLDEHGTCPRCVLRVMPGRIQDMYCCICLNASGDHKPAVVIFDGYSLCEAHQNDAHQQSRLCLVRYRRKIPSTRDHRRLTFTDNRRA